jgi:hypothetical protein
LHGAALNKCIGLMLLHQGSNVLMENQAIFEARTAISAPHHKNVGDVQASDQSGHWLLRWLAVALLQAAGLMLKVLSQKLLKVMQLQGAWLAQASCRQISEQQYRVSGQRLQLRLLQHLLCILHLPASAITRMQCVCSLRQPISSLSLGSQLQT